MADYQVLQFESKMEKAMQRVKVVLDATKSPSFAANVHHRYQDKYILAEHMTNAAAASQVNCLTILGFTPTQISQLCEWAKTKEVSLRFRAEERCKFDREEKKDVENPTRRETELSVGGVVKAALSSKVVTTVTEYFWRFEAMYELTAICGAGHESSDKMQILTRTGRVELKTSTETPPRPEAKVPSADFDVPISWLLRQLQSDTMAPRFHVNREHKDCHTPRRNVDVDNALTHFSSLRSWAQQVAQHITGLLSVQPDPSHKLDLNSLSEHSIFVPVLPLLEESGGTAADPAATETAAEGVLAQITSGTVVATDSASLSISDLNRLLGDEMSGLREKRSSIREAFPSGDEVATAVEAELVVTLKHCACVCSQWAEAMDYIEGMLRKQLIAAIGKEVTPADFSEYMRFHNRKLFGDAYAPVPFCCSVRRSDTHTPEGSVSIEQAVAGPGGGDSNIPAPIVTLVARSTQAAPMSFPLSASTNVTFGGERYLHAYLSHEFSGQSGAKLSLVSRARQFSSFLVLVGRVASAHSFEPKYAAIVQNKDELKIPLDLSTIPTPKEFKDAIESLSPEQQSFAKAFRCMQLESTLFGVLIIHIKPQLEKVLNLPDDSLTKEIKLTQELMQLFIKYQIPSDLLSFDGTAGDRETNMVGPVSNAEKVEVVKSHVKAMTDMIDEAKNEEVAERRQQAEFADPFGAMMGGCGGGVRSQAMDMGMDGMMPMMADMCAPPAKGCGGKGKGPPTRAPAGKCGPPPPGSGMPPPPGSAPASRSSAKGQTRSAAPSASASMVASAVAAPSQTSAPPQQTAHRANTGEDGGASRETVSGRDYTQVPREMDEQFERLDVDGALRPTIISPGSTWTVRRQKALLANPTESRLGSTEQKKEKDAALDLLDALTKSGALPVEHACLHIVVAATHCFDKTVTETVVQDNISPIDKVERSTLIMAATVHQQPASALIRDAQTQRVRDASPMLFELES